MKYDGLKVFSGNSNRALADEICEKLGIGLSKAEVHRFKDGEVSVKILESVRNSDVFIIQPTCAPANDNIMELLLMIDAAYRASARRVTAVVPYYGYSRQDRKVEPRVPISAKVVANLLEAVKVSRILTMDLHADQIQGFFNTPVDNLFATPVMIEYLSTKKIEDLVIVSPDSGGVDRARFLAKKMNAGLAIIDKRRPRANVCEIMNVIGDVKGKTCLILDDIIDTAGSISGAGKALLNNGAKEIYCTATHAVLSGNAAENLNSAGFKEVIITNTIPVGSKKEEIQNLKVLSVAKLIAEAINRIHEGTSVSSLFV
ncbi:MAG TPA: ribose-phosphate pyrophosphokinase [Spirochaetota bacterium]|nr:ribose-phosphate pyrophosphokinase [Spirochaetota bacterium]